MEQARNYHRFTPPQFTLLALFEYTTLCCVLAALAGVVGIGASVCLMGLGLALAARHGGWALAALMAASLIAGSDPNASGGFAQQLATILTAAVVCGWYRFRAVASSPVRCGRGP